jgi:hypothetical protein
MTPVTIHSISPDRQERYDTVRPEMIAKTIKILQRKGQLNIKVLPVENSKQ